MANGSGLFRVSDLKRGQYAFAKGDVSAHVNEVEALDITVWPNPASSLLNITCKGGISPFRVLNSLGQKMIDVSHTAHAESWQLDLNGWAKGWYVLENDAGDSLPFMVE